MYVVILAGGGGTRLWPLSRPETPKPFLPLLGEDSLLQRTVARVVGHAELGLTTGDVTVVTDRRYGSLVRTQCPGVRVISEPVGRNTAAAIALATVLIERDEDDVMCVLPADHLIAPDREGVFRRVLAGAARLAGGAFEVDSPLVTLGIAVDRPATEYGYLLPVVERGAKVGDLRAYPLRAFEEKPSRDRAAELLHEPAVAWNAGIFLWRRRAIRDALERYTGLVTLLGSVGSSEAAMINAYEQARSISIDHAVMESAAHDRRVVMAAMDVGWSDLGSWTALLAALGANATGRVIQANEPADVLPDDLLVERVSGRLVVEPGPRGILATTPTALLRGAAPDRTIVEALVDRVRRWEEPS
ncbi:MAG: NTP transferase domain-containing protein [Chloroflexi bacterium]|nr:NTP transferase domain-containing protein [Chloroflexota bacterium]